MSPQPKAGAVSETKAKKPPPPVRPSASVLLLSPTNQVLLLARVKTSTSFASAHVFPGGNLSSFHDGTLPSPGDPAYHRDGPAYRLAAIRETFEESGILLAKKLGQSREAGLLQLADDVREAGRKLVHANKVKFADWLREHGGEPDIDNLIPFTRWITPHGPPRRFTTQMYLYFLPTSAADAPVGPGGLLRSSQTLIPTPTHDGGIEHTAAAFDDATRWLARARSGEIVMFPPQFYLLTLVAEQLAKAGGAEQQRAALLDFLGRTPTSTRHPQRPTSAIPWADKVMSPSVVLARRSDGRTVLGLDNPGSELAGSGRGGDWERVVVVKFGKNGPTRLEVRPREEVLVEERVDGKEGSRL
ncbi:hypothetical protein VTJ83DRAFT_153 [Remersonia thermophila]|uniref:Nudix hydrolase domain-containing protein n=1 Tax=Remersonia thermophila TaxID=72144 RepID=A0ABR4DM59_9PEZI